MNLRGLAVFAFAAVVPAAAAAAPVVEVDVIVPSVAVTSSGRAFLFSSRLHNAVSLQPRTTTTAAVTKRKTITAATVAEDEEDERDGRRGLRDRNNIFSHTSAALLRNDDGDDGGDGDVFSIKLTVDVGTLALSQTTDDVVDVSLSNGVDDGDCDELPRGRREARRRCRQKRLRRRKRRRKKLRRRGVAAASVVEFSGPLSRINAALEGMRYRPPAGEYAGRPALTVTVSSLGSGGGGVGGDGGAAPASSMAHRKATRRRNVVRKTLRIAVNARMDEGKARDVLTSGVTEMHSGNFPGRMVCYGTESIDVVLYKNDDDDEDSSSDEEGPMIGAARWGKGRVVAMPDHQMLNMGEYGDVSGTFYKNAIAWLAGTTTADLHVAIVVYDSASADWLASQGYANVVLTNEADLAADLTADADVFIAGWMGPSEPDSNLDAVSDFVAVRGGGLFVADYGVGYSWWWETPYHQAPANRLLREAGVGFGDGYRYHRGSIDATAVARGKHVSAEAVLAMMLEKDPSSSSSSLGYGSEELGRKAGYVLDMLFDVLPPEGDPLLGRIDDAFRRRIDKINPTPRTPVTDGFEKALLRREADILSNLSPDRVTAHRTAEAVYGRISPSARRVDAKAVRIDLTRTRWQPTGTYAVPGEVVTVTVPPELVGRGYRVRINAHTDDVSRRNEWKRPPRVHRSFEIDAKTIEVANAFGGAIFLDLGGEDGFSAPPSSSSGGGSNTVFATVSNAVEHPYFVLGEHSDDDWIGGHRSFRDKPAPYAVFVSPNLIFAQPASDAFDLTEPTELMTWWNDMVALQDDLAARPESRTGAELINVDVQISHGGAHAGYPIQAYREHWGNLADLDRLRTEGSWGDFHEVGHNHQRGWWTFSGHTEVTVNIFSAWCLKNMASSPPVGGGGFSGWSTDALATIDRTNTASAETSYHSFWLTFWLNQAHWFGFDKLRDTFATYEHDNLNDPSALPSTDQEEHDEWIVRFSRRVGHDITRFARDVYGLSVSDGAAWEVATMDLPGWMPAYPGVYGSQSVPVGESLVLDLRGQAKSLDGIVTVEIVSQGSFGSVANNGDGTLTTYTPHKNMRAGRKDSFTYAVISSAGNRQTATLDITLTH